jgi:ATP-dependent DNA helicase RecG
VESDKVIFMYSLDTPIDTIDGIGPKLLEKFAEKNIQTFKDLLLFLPLRYSDRSEIVQINDLEIDKLVSFPATVSKVSSFYKNRRKIDSATAKDESGKVKLMWFNSKFIAQSVKPDTKYMISGKLNKRGTIIQPTLEKISEDEESAENKSSLDSETIHTGRLVPLYSTTLDIQQGKLRRILKKALAKYQLSNRDEFFENPENLLNIKEALTQLHFPDSEDLIVAARERLALEELLALIKTSEKIKNYWKSLQSAQSVAVYEPKIPTTIPFELTGAQSRCIDEILKDITTKTPMNRVLIGDVGSGKTVVAGVAANHSIKSGLSVALVAPTKILAEQHFETLNKLFPDLKIELLTGRTTKKMWEEILSNHQADINPDTGKNTNSKFFVGTHALINKLEQINPGLIIYDEQHRFGVNQRSESSKLKEIAHTLTMSATPIPRSLMLTIFSHLKVSAIDELPKGRIPTKTWIVPEKKRAGAYNWIAEELNEEAKIAGNENTDSQKLALIVCPFIDPSNHEAFENVASANETFKAVKAEFKKLEDKKKFKIALLHGRMKPDEQALIIKKLYDKKIDILVTTPVVEVGVDLPTASIIVIEASERFGMASLHQLRGRVGRAGQQGYCLLFSNAKSNVAKERLKNFSNENNGLKLAELDLQSRGSGDIFGTTQSGFSNLKFATWTNLELIGQAKQIYETLPKNWQPFLGESENTDKSKPLAN